MQRLSCVSRRGRRLQLCSLPFSFGSRLGEGFRIHSKAGKALARSSRSGDQSSFSSSHPALALFAVVVCHPVRKDDCSQELLHSYSPFSRDIPEFPVDVSLNCLHELDVQSSLPIGVFGGLGIIGQRPQLPPYVGFCVLSGDNCRNSRHVRLPRVPKSSGKGYRETTQRGTATRLYTHRKDAGLREPSSFDLTRVMRCRPGGDWRLVEMLTPGLLLVSSQGT